MLAPALARAAAARARAGAGDEARWLADKAPRPLPLLDALSRAIPADAYLEEARINGKEARIAGLATSAASLPGLLEADPLITAARFSAPVARVASLGRQRFELDFKVAR